ncbi:hypothetical protein BDW66DRAFT_130636 [Aspergillus desertorum]
MRLPRLWALCRLHQLYGVAVAWICLKSPAVGHAGCVALDILWRVACNRRYPLENDTQARGLTIFTRVSSRFPAELEKVSKPL